MNEPRLPADVTAAVAMVCDIEAEVLRADTPLADIGADDVAIISILLRMGAAPASAGHQPSADVVAAARNVATVGDIAQIAELLRTGA